MMDDPRFGRLPSPPTRELRGREAQVECVKSA
jgi:hypothetical protein